MDQQGKDGAVIISGKDGKELDKVEEHVEKYGDVQGITSGNASVDHTVEDKKPIKRKVIEKVVKKVIRQRPTTETSGVNSSQEDKAVVAGSASKTVDEQIQLTTEDAGKQKVGVINNQQPQTKKSGKKKIIRRIVKRKVSTLGSKLNDPAVPAETSKPVVEVQPVKSDEGLTEAGKLQTKLAEVLNTPAKEISNDRNEEKADKEGHTSTKDKKSHGNKISEQEVVKQKDMKKEEKNVNKNKDDKEKKNGDPKRDPKQRSLGESKEKKRPDAPPRHPGFILQAKRSKGSKLRSASLSLDGLLNYTTNDVEETVFELSLFAESFSEMLQYRMGCIILSFLEKLHRRYVIKNNQHKRPREEDPVIKKEDKKLSDKRPKATDDIHFESTPNNNNPLTDDAMTKVGEEKMILDNSASAHDEPEAEERMEDEDPEYEEDPEEVEIYASDEDMDNTTAEEQTEAKAELLNNTEAKPEVKTEDNGNKEIGKELKLEKIASFDEKPATGVDKQSITEKEGVQVGKRGVGKEEKTAVTQTEDSAKDEVVDKDLLQDLLQAFRYFDQNKVGCIKVEDLRCIVHNLRKCLSNKDVKDLAETAHAESNSARDGRVINTKLVKIVDL